MARGALCHARPVVDRADMVRTALGMLTAAYGASRSAVDGEGSKQDGYKIAYELMGEAMSFQMRLENVPRGSADLLHRVADEVAAGVQERTGWLAYGFMEAFVALARVFERECPEADVPDVLQYLALQADKLSAGEAEDV